MVLPEEGKPNNVSLTEGVETDTQNPKQTFLKKVMFLVAVGVPRMNHTTATYFDGNLGCSP